jgi:hypothetical protein
MIAQGDHDRLNYTYPVKKVIDIIACYIDSDEHATLIPEFRDKIHPILRGQAKSQ